MKQLKIIIYTAALAFSGAWAANLNVDDAQIAQIMQTANQGEIDAAKTAMNRAKNAEVKAYAEKMAKEHAESIKELAAVSSKESLTPKESAQAATLEMDAKRKLQTLAKAPANGFDKIYMQTQVDVHETLLKDLDSKLILSASDPGLKSYLQKTRAHVAEHLEQAKKLRSALK